MKQLYTLFLLACCAIGAQAGNIKLEYKGETIPNGGTMIITDTDPDLAAEGLVQFAAEASLSSAQDAVASVTVTVEGENQLEFCALGACMMTQGGTLTVPFVPLTAEPVAVTLHNDGFFFEPGVNTVHGKLTVVTADETYVANILMTDDENVIAAVAGVKADTAKGDVTIATLGGAVVYRGKANAAPALPAGLYIYKAGGEAKKIMK